MSLRKFLNCRLDTEINTKSSFSMSTSNGKAVSIEINKNIYDNELFGLAEGKRCNLLNLGLLC